MAAEHHKIEVWADWESLRGAVLVGVLHALPSRGRHVFSFEYSESWLRDRPGVPLDPDLQPVRGPQYVADGGNFGVFLDSAPDRWGRVLMQRREALLAREGKRVERRLTELDYLLGVYDGHRMGGLRYRIGGGPYLDDNAELASPLWTSLRDLEHASLRLERQGAERDPKYSAWLRTLFAPGRSLGGARPKASVIDPQRQLWLAKFPSVDDEVDIGAWESVVHTLATRAGIDTAPAKRLKFYSRHHTFLTKRFDRTDTGGRVHFASAMTLLNRNDGDPGASYLDIAELIGQHGARPARDLEQLWRRIVFFICISNVDDHLRNHGFLLTADGWSLAPAYDMNPNADGNGLVLNISQTDNSQDLVLARDVAPHFRVKSQRAGAIIDEVTKVVSGWSREAAKAKLSRADRDRMAPAFRVVSDAQAQP